MSWDIYGNPLKQGHCEAHPHVAEEYPCSVCLSVRQQREDATRQCPDCKESEHYLGLAQEHIKVLENQRNDLLAALEAFRAVGGKDFDGWASAYDAAIEMARAAIKKAKGE